MILTFSEHFLLEDRIKTLKTKIFKDGFDTSHDTNAAHKDTDAIVDHFADKADPTNKKIHTQWVLNQYKKKNIRQEDHPRIHAALTNFEAHKPKLEKKDLNQYKHISEVEDAVEPHMGEATSKKAEKKAIKAEGADLIHNQDGVTVHHLKTKKAAQQYGKGTKWCTAGEQYNMFDMYNDDGPIHVIHHGDRKYQFHNESEQFMDEKDHEVHFDKINIDPAIAKSLINSDHPEIQRANILFKNPYVNSSTLSKALNSSDYNLKKNALSHPNLQAHHISQALQPHHEEPIRARAVLHRSATAAHLDHGLKDPSFKVRENVFRTESPQLNSSHVDQGIMDDDLRVRQVAIRHASAKQLDKVVNGAQNTTLHFHAAWNPNLQPRHISTIIKHGKPGSINAVLNHEKATTDHFDEVPLHTSHPDVLYKAVSSDKISSKGLGRIFERTDSSRILEKIAGHKNASPEIIAKALEHPDEYVRMAAIKNKYAPISAIDKALNDKNSGVRAFAIHHPKMQPEHLDKALKDHDLDVKAEVMTHPKATSDHLEHAFNQAKESHKEHMLDLAAKHPNLTDDQLHRIIQHGGDPAMSALKNPNFKEEHMDTFMDNNNPALVAYKHPHFTQKHWDKFESQMRSNYKDQKYKDSDIDDLVLQVKKASNRTRMSHGLSEFK